MGVLTAVDTVQTWLNETCQHTGPAGCSAATHVLDIEVGSSAMGWACGRPDAGAVGARNVP